MRGKTALFGMLVMAVAVAIGWQYPVERADPLVVAAAPTDGGAAPSITPAPSQAETAEPAERAAVAEEPAEREGDPYVTSANVRMRSGPSSNFDIVWTAPVGTAVRSLQRDGNWHFVRADGYEGWIFGRYLRETATQ